MGLEDGSEVHNASCSFWRPEFGFQQLCKVAYNCLYLWLLGIWNPLLISRCILILRQTLILENQTKIKHKKKEQDELTSNWKDSPDDLSESDSVAWFAFLWSSHLPSQPSNCGSLNIRLQLCLFFWLNAHRYKHPLMSLNLIKYIVIFYSFLPLM